MEADNTTLEPMLIDGRETMQFQCVLTAPTKEVAGWVSRAKRFPNIESNVERSTVFYFIRCPANEKAEIFKTRSTRLYGPI